MAMVITAAKAPVALALATADQAESDRTTAPPDESVVAWDSASASTGAREGQYVRIDNGVVSLTRMETCTVMILHI